MTATKLINHAVERKRECFDKNQKCNVHKVDWENCVDNEVRNSCQTGPTCEKKHRN